MSSTNPLITDVWRTGSGHSKRFAEPLAAADGDGIRRHPARTANTKAPAAATPARVPAWPSPIDSYGGEPTPALPPRHPVCHTWPGVQRASGTAGNMTSRPLSVTSIDSCPSCWPIGTRHWSVRAWRLAGRCRPGRAPGPAVPAKTRARARHAAARTVSPCWWPRWRPGHRAPRRDGR